MSIVLNSSYSQLQDWHARQKALTDKQLGSPSSWSSSQDFSGTFASISASAFSGSATITAQTVVSRTASKFQLLSKQGNVDANFGANAAKSAGNAILAQLGYAGYSANTANSSNYSAPVNYSTGKAYVKTSGANLNNLSTLSMFA